MQHSFKNTSIFRALLLGIATLFYTGFSAIAAQVDDVDLFVPAGVTIQYDPFVGLPGLQTLEIEVTYTGNSTKLARLVITPENQPNFRLANTEASFPFEISANSGSFSQSRFEMPVMLSPTPTPQIIALSFKITAGQYVDENSFSADLSVNLLDGATLTSLSDERTLSASSIIAPRAQTNFAGVGAGYQNGTSFALVDFGELKTGISRTVNFQVRGNTDVNIEISSENGGKMVEQGSAGQNPIPYQVSVDGVSIDLSSPQNLLRQPMKSLSGSSYPLEITIGNPENGFFSGLYRDVITIDVTPG